MDRTAKQTRNLPSRSASVDRAGEAQGSNARGMNTNLKPSSRYVAKDLSDGGSVPLLSSTLLSHGHAGRGRLTVRGRAANEGVRQKRNEDQRVVHPADKSLSAISGVVGSQGSLAPLGAVVKVAGMADLKFAEPARFDGEEARFRTVKNKKYREGEVLVILNERPQRGPGMREVLAIRDAVALLFSRLFCVARMSEAISGILAPRQGRPAETCHAVV